MHKLFLISLLTMCCNAVYGQGMLYQHDTSVKVYAYGAERSMAWCGGFNNPQFAMGDLNKDGLPDLVVFENFNSLRTFINTGTAGNPIYSYEPQYEANFPPVMDYIVLADYNCDGIPDLFQQGIYGFAVYSGYYNDKDQLCFTFYKYLFYDNDPSTGSVNAFNNPGDIPAIVDVDGDGDLDFISYNIIGGAMNFYRNMRVEESLPCDSIVIHLEDQCWGKVYQGFYRTHELAYECSNAGLVLPRYDSLHRVTHSGNTPCLFDWDGDGDYDYLDGSISFNQMTFLENGRIPDNPTGPDSMVYQDTMWQSYAGGHQIDIPIWAAAFNIDIDQDGKKDLLVAPNEGLGTENYNCIWFYKNNTTPGAPDWPFQSDSFLIDRTIDLGSSAYPMLYDYNKDGKPDLFIGSDGYRQADGTLKSRISYYMNTSTPGNPSFTLQTTDFMGLSSYNFQGIAPAFGDIDNDGKDDLVLGHTDGTLSYFKNTAAADTAEPVWTLQELMLTDNAGDTINTYGYAAPFIYDLDKDGKKDLLIGDFDGYIQYYENVTTSPGNIAISLANQYEGGVHVDSNQIIGTYSTPFIGKIDTSGIDYLMVGANSGDIYQYSGFQTGDTAATFTMVSDQFDYIDSLYLVYNNEGTPYAMYEDLRSSVTVGDIAGDGSFYMITGNNKGGVELYKLKTYVPDNIHSLTEQGKVQVYPNPAQDVLNISWSGIVQQNVQISILNMEGQAAETATAAAGAGKQAISLASLPPGIYVCILQSGVNRYYNKFTIIR